jgi:cytochrome c oxidase assembly protein subunit 15
MKKSIGIWLLACSALVWIILVSGGVTRLTHSGLSIVEWKPVVGSIPPLSPAQWEEEFAKYRRTPEYIAVNAGMSLGDFKSIYLMEYAHRLMGRIAGLVFVLPFLYFAFKGRIDRPMIPKLAMVSILWAFQGVLGWYMVASGLVNEPHVSHYRLTAHLLTACLLYAAMLSTALELLKPADAVQARPLPVWLGAFSAVMVVLALITITSGGLVAGLHAGLSFNTFPLMGGYWVPPFLLEQQPLARNFFENLVTVQFDHRWLAIVLALSVLAGWLGGLYAGLSRRVMTALHILAGVMAAQISLGILTLLYRVPVVLGAAHQGTALLLLGAALLVRHEASAARS